MTVVITMTVMIVLVWLWWWWWCILRITCLRACSLKKNWNDDGSGFWSFWSLGFGECDIYCCYYYYYLFFFCFCFCCWWGCGWHWRLEFLFGSLFSLSNKFEILINIQNWENPKTPKFVSCFLSGFLGFFYDRTWMVVLWAWREFILCLPILINIVRSKIKFILCLPFRLHCIIAYGNPMKKIKYCLCFLCD